MSVVCEVGPGAVRLLRSGTADSPDTADSLGRLVDAVLEACGEPLALVDDQPVRTDVLWRCVFERVLAGADNVALVHPSWWNPHWVHRVAAAARQVAGNVTTVSRSGLLHRETAFVEIAPDLVVVGDRGGRIQAESRLAEPDRVADAVAARVGVGGLVHIDVPVDVPGAEDLGSLVAQRLRAAGTTVRHLDHRDLSAAAAARSDPQESAESLAAPTPGRGMRAAVGVAALIVVAVAAGVVAAAVAPRRPAGGEMLVEGRVAVRVPADWPVQRVTGGPGSTLR